MTTFMNATLLGATTFVPASADCARLPAGLTDLDASRITAAITGPACHH